jgi:hypothetical protein
MIAVNMPRGSLSVSSFLSSLLLFLLSLALLWSRRLIKFTPHELYKCQLARSLKVEGLLSSALKLNVEI